MKTENNAVGFVHVIINPGQPRSVRISLMANWVTVLWGRANTQTIRIDKKNPARKKINRFFMPGQHYFLIVTERMTTLDISNCDCTAITLRKCNWLKHLNCSHNQLTELQNLETPVLETLLCEKNRISSLHLASQTLSRLSCRGNKLTKLDLSKCENLRDIDCSRNKITQLQIANCRNIENLNCSGKLINPEVFCKPRNL